MIIYRTTPNDDKAIIYLNKLWQDNWIYCGQLNDKLVFRKEEKKVVTKNKIETWDDFDNFYLLYPRKIAKKQAQKEWIRLNEKEKTLAIDWLKKWNTYWKIHKTEKQYISHPSSWLSAQRWNDELDIPIPPEEKYQEELKKDLEEEKKNEQDKLLVNNKILELKNSGEYERIEKEAISQLTEVQLNSMFRNRLIDIRVRMIINSTYF